MRATGCVAPASVRGGGPGTRRDRQQVALAASSMRSAVIFGWLIITTWDEVGTSTTLRAFARLYIQRSHSGGIALSWPATSPHDGIVRHAAAVVGKTKESASNGRWVACRSRNVAAGM